MVVQKYTGGANTDANTTGSLTASVPGVGATFACDDLTGFPVGDFVVAIDRGTVSNERVLVTRVTSSDTLTVVSRGYDGTTAKIHALGATVHHVWDAASAQRHEDHVFSAHGASGIAIDMNGELLSEADIAAYTEKIVTAANTTGGTYAMDLAVANVFDVTLSVATTFSFTNVPINTAKASSITLILRNGATAYAATWPASVKWAGVTAPTLSGVNKADIITMTTFDSGATWAAMAVQDFSGVGV